MKNPHECGFFFAGEIVPMDAALMFCCAPLFPLFN
jgi:hypothetical protein